MPCFKSIPPSPQFLIPVWHPCTGFGMGVTIALSPLSCLLGLRVLQPGELEPSCSRLMSAQLHAAYLCGMCPDEL